MAGLSDFISGAGMWSQDSDTLIRMAQAGSLPAYKELINRGEMVPGSRTPKPPVRPIITRNMNRAAMDAPDPMDPALTFGNRGRALTPGSLPDAETPPYLQRGISRDMGRPSDPGEPLTMPMDPALTFGNRGRALTPGSLPGADIPPYLLGDDAMGGELPPGTPPWMVGAGTPPFAPGAGGQPSAAQQRLSKIANGGDIAGSIQAGSAAADQDAGVNPMAEVPGPMAALAQAFADSEAPETEESQGIADIIKKMMAGTDPTQARNMALAQAGFAMAGSGSPTFFGAVGQGGLAGLKSYQDTQREDMANRLAGARLASDQQAYKENYRSHRRSEALDVARQGETVAENQRAQGRFERKQGEDERAAKAGEGLRGQEIANSRRNSDIAAYNAETARMDYEQTLRAYNAGEADAKALRAAQIRKENADAAAAEALEIDRSTDVLDTDQGFVSYNNRTKQTTPITLNGEPVKARPKSAAAGTWAAKVQAMKDGGYTPEMIAAVAAGQKTISYAEATKIADAAAANRSKSFFGTKADTVYQETFDQVRDDLLSQVGPTPPAAGGTPSPEGPSKVAPTAMKGSGTQADPYKGSGQADIDWFKANAPKGAVIAVNGKTYTKP